MVAMFLHDLLITRVHLQMRRNAVRWCHAALVCNELAELKTNS